MWLDFVLQSLHTTKQTIRYFSCILLYDIFTDTYCDLKRHSIRAQPLESFAVLLGTSNARSTFCLQASVGIKTTRGNEFFSGLAISPAH